MRSCIQMPLALANRLPSGGHLPPVHETDLDRILKLIPTEVLALNLAAAHVTDQPRSAHLPLLLFVVGVALVPLVLYFDGWTMNAPARWPQYVVRTIVFITWSPAISWPFTPWLAQDDLTPVISLGVLLVPLAGAYVLRPHSARR